MRIILTFQPIEGTLTLPIQYNSLLQGMIYHNLERSLADWLHDKGISFGKRRFKLFTFSRLMGRYRIVRNDRGRFITFSGLVKLHVGSVHDEFLSSLAEHLLRYSPVLIGEWGCEVESVEVEEMPEVSMPVKVKAISPITVYSTLMTGDGRKKTYYYSPFEGEWEKHILANLLRKGEALGWEDDKLKELSKGHVRPIRVRKSDESVVMYRETVIKGWMGIYELNLSEPFFRLAYDAGLGAKNSQGFGMVEVIRKEEDRDDHGD
ncbi:TPA: CRISPR-associated endoribonuclease Cas6 [Candidatus Poribacteria bacterium]|nr:CRISPR-associated endoribonuclease Cas6 [Candidatus Poribacteria bacterium]